MFLSCHDAIPFPFRFVFMFVGHIPQLSFFGDVLFISFSQYGRRSGSYMFTHALHCFVFGQGPETYSILRVQRRLFLCDRDAR